MKNSRRTKQIPLMGQVGGLKRGFGQSFDHFKRDMMKQIFAMKFSGKSDNEIVAWLQEEYNKALQQKERNNG